MSVVIKARGREVLERTRVRGDHTWDLRHGHADLLRKAPIRHTRLHFDVVPTRSWPILEVMVARGRRMDTLRGTITACATLLQRYVDRHPGATDLADLAADDIDAYLVDRVRGHDGEVDERRARAAQAEAACFVRFLEERRDAGDPLIPARFWIYPLRRRIALLSAMCFFGTPPRPSGGSRDGPGGDRGRIWQGSLGCANHTWA
jgi:hypothetical protein